MTQDEIDQWFDNVLTYLDEMEYRAACVTQSPFIAPEIKQECAYFESYYSDGAEWLDNFFSREFPK